MIVETEILTSDNELENLGIESTHTWLRAAVDFNKIELIRETCKKGVEYPSEDRCGIWTHSGETTIKMSYDQAVSIWKSEPITKNPQYL